MATIAVSLTAADPAVLLPVEGSLVQNLGPGVLWLGQRDDVDNTNGIRLGVDQAIVFDNAGAMYGYAQTSDCDVRIQSAVYGIARIDAT